MSTHNKADLSLTKPSAVPLKHLSFSNFYFVFVGDRVYNSCLLSSGNAQGIYRPLLGTLVALVGNRRNLGKAATQRLG